MVLITRLFALCACCSAAQAAAACQDENPGVCCQAQKGTCGVAACADYKKVAPSFPQKDILNYGCQGAEQCCFYLGNGGAYCQSCASSNNTCHDNVPGVCCQAPKGTCGVAACSDYKKVAPSFPQKDIQNYGCQGAEQCCFYLGNGGAYCQSCASDTNICHDENPGVCCQAPKGTCGVAACSDYKKVAPAFPQKDIKDYGCQGAEQCCFYVGNGGAYCKSCTSTDSVGEQMVV